MKAKHTVKINGVWYREGCDIPSPSLNAKEETPDKLTKSKIVLMKQSDLRELAKKHGVENADEKQAAELKEILLNILGL